MPVEDEAQRETFGDAPGWSDRETTTEPQKKGVAGASPTPDAEPAPSAEPSQDEGSSVEPAPEQAPPTPSQPEPADVPFNQHPRWIERQRELEEARRQRDEAMRLAQEAVSRPVQAVQPSAPQVDPWERLVNDPDPVTAQGWRNLQSLMQHERRQAKLEAVQELQPVIQAGMEKLAQFDLRDFRKENPDIKPGSADEQQIVSYMNGQVDGVRHPLESAKRNVLFDRLKTEVTSLKTKQAAIPQKRAAASSESSAGIPAGAGLPPKPGDWRERAGAVVDKGGSMMDAAKAIFG